MSYYSPNPHYNPTDYSEMNEKLAKCEQEAGKWFNSATAVQQAVYNRTIADLAPYKNSPRWLREREKAMAVFAETTKAAAEVYEMARVDLMLTGEVSEATSAAYDALMVAGPPVAVVEKSNVAYADFRRASDLEGSRA